MFTVDPQLIQFHRQNQPTQPVRQVVEPGAGVNGRTTHRPSPASRRKSDGEGNDFHALFMNALSKNAT